jgi:glycosyltransferase involved in cell wall biosynthesis
MGAVDVRIGVIQSSREVEVDIADDADRDELLSEIEKLLEKGDGVLWLTDRRGRRVGVPVPKVAYVEVGGHSGARRVGFGAA